MDEPPGAPLRQWLSPPAPPRQWESPPRKGGGRKPGARGGRRRVGRILALLGAIDGISPPDAVDPAPRRPPSAQIITY